MVQIVLTVQNAPTGLHGVPAGKADSDLNHPFHTGNLPNIVANATFDADGAAILIHQNPDTYQTGTRGQGVGGGNAIACGVIVK